MAKRRAAPPTDDAIATATAEANYGRHKERMRERAADESRKGRDIGPLPEVVDPDRREACRRDFKLFCETYLSVDTFTAPWASDHLVAIDRIERTVIQGGNYVITMPRGNGKSSLNEAGAVWAEFYGWHKYVVILCSTDEKYMEEAQASIKTILETNDLLYADFPEICHPIRCLDGQTNKQRGQHINGVRTNVNWNGKRLILPTVDGSEASGGIIGGGGLGAKSIRGTRFRDRRTGKVWRPSLVLIEDPQTDESAESPQQCAKLEKLILGGVMGMAGPGAKLSLLMSATVIKRGDTADRMSDREKHPEFHGMRCAMLTSWPVNMLLWEQYREIRNSELRSDDDLLLDNATEDPHPKATAFLQEHFAEMHLGASVSWEYRRRPYELSAVQHAMHLYFRDPLGFWSEYQNWLTTPNAPADPESSEDLRLDRDRLATKVSGYGRGVIPTGVQWLTVGIDCHDRVLTWMVCGWEPGFSGHIIDYGTYPDTPRDTWEVGTFRPTLQEKSPKAGPEGALTEGLTALTDLLLKRSYKREDGAVLSPRMTLIDTGYMSAVIRRFIAASGMNERIVPSFGRAPDENEAAISSYKQRTGEQLGDEWLIRLPQKGAGRQSGLRHILFDANHWKTFAARRLLGVPGDAGCVEIFGHKASTTKQGRGQPASRHDFLARHFCSETPSEVTGRRKMTKWRIRPGETNNHWFDNFVQCCVGASMLGVKPPGSPALPTTATPVTQRPRITLTGPDGRPFFVTDR